VTGDVVRYPDADHLAAGVAHLLVERLAEEQRSGREPRLVLTGGTIADRIHAAVAAEPPRDDLRWDLVDIWYGDERYVPKADPDRNALQARRAMLDQLPVDPAKVHEMPAADGQYGSDVEAAALAYGAELVATAPADGPWFDVLMLGVGPDGHCASLFPGRAEVTDPAPVLAVRQSPKPPPTRISLGMTTLQRAREVWFVVSGAGKAEAVASALGGADPVDVPAAGVSGLERTVWFLDGDAAWML
jgi:6-phosphogluconolactonase